MMASDYSTDCEESLQDKASGITAEPLCTAQTMETNQNIGLDIGGDAQQDDRIDESDLRWETMLRGLYEYQLRHNTLIVPRDYRWDDRNLYEWSRNQRKHYLNGTRGKTPALLPKRIERLRSIGFELDPTGAHGQNDAFDDKRWVAMFEGLREFHQKHGTFAVPAGYLCDGRSLHEWMRHQRKQYSLTMKKAGRAALSSERIERLMSIGFDLDPTGRRQDKRNEDERWEVMVQGLLEYKKKNGTFRLPEGYFHDGRNLFSWAHNQRRLYANLLRNRPPVLLPERIKRLTEIGFALSPRRSAEFSSSGSSKKRKSSSPPRVQVDFGPSAAYAEPRRQSSRSFYKPRTQNGLPLTPTRLASAAATRHLAMQALARYQRMSVEEREQWQNQPNSF